MQINNRYMNCHLVLMWKETEVLQIQYQRQMLNARPVPYKPLFELLLETN